MRRTTIWATIGLSFALWACASAPRPEEVAAAYYGPAPSGPEQIVRAFMQTHLRDPASAQYRMVMAPNRRWQRDLGGPVEYGWGVCYAVNARNGFGGYTGERLHFFMIRDGAVVQHIYAQNDDDIFGRAIARNACDRSSTNGGAKGRLVHIGRAEQRLDVAEITRRDPARPHRKGWYE